MKILVIFQWILARTGCLILRLRGGFRDRRDWVAFGLLALVSPGAHGSPASDFTTLQAELADLRERVERLEDLAGARVGLEVSVDPGERELAAAGEQHFAAFCAACHGDAVSFPRVAPPTAKMLKHYGAQFGDDRAPFVQAMVSSVKTPGEARTLMPGAIRNFKIMPTQAGPARGGRGNGSAGCAASAGPSGEPLVSMGSLPAAPNAVLISDRARRGQAKFAGYCQICHRPDRTAPLLAPPVFAVSDHYRQRYGDDRDAFVQAIVAWTQHPDEAKSLMPGAVPQFNLMGAMPLPESDLTAIATFLFETDFSKPDWYDAHYAAEHDPVVEAKYNAAPRRLDQGVEQPTD